MSDWDYKTWWREHGSKQRKNRYRTDAAYRRKQRRWSKAWRDGRTRVRAGRRTRSTRKPLRLVVRVEQDLSPHMRHVDAMHVCWSIGVLARVVGRSVRTMELWEEKTLLPPTPLRHRGERYYTADMVKDVARIVALRGTVDRRDELFYYEVLSAWQHSSNWDYLVNGKMEPLAELGSFRLPNGELVYTIDAVVAATGRTLSTVVSWERYAMVPPSPILLGLDESMYTTSMVDAIVEHWRGGDGDLFSLWKREAKRLLRLGVRQAMENEDGQESIQIRVDPVRIEGVED